MAAIGDVDEANSAIGVAIVALDASPERDLLGSIQNDLFDLGADLATPWTGAPDDGALRVTAGQVERIEAAIDDANATLEPLTSFILPGGSAAAAAMHLARATVRRAERAMVAAQDAHGLNPTALTYVNRLSDLLFVLARKMNQKAGGDVLWVPGASR
jgi:cob(I)alamin adenosyltransferase